METIVQILNKNELFLEAAKYIQNLALKTINQKGIFNIALSGGNTPKPVYKILADDLKDTFSWDKTDIFLVDERCVPINHANRNFLMIKNTILKNSLIPTKNIHNLPYDLENPKKSALVYEEYLKKYFNNTLPKFDLIILGIGDDGHTASLFPDNKKDLNEKKRWVLDVYTKNGNPPGYRITLTLKIINNSENVLFLASGSNKKDIVYKTLIKKDKDLPASLVKPQGRLIWLLDEEAGELLLHRKKKN